jgi:hypothetical protein
MIFLLVCLTKQIICQASAYSAILSIMVINKTLPTNFIHQTALMKQAKTHYKQFVKNNQIFQYNFAIFFFLI